MADTDKQAKDNKGTKRKNMKKTRPPFDGPFGPRGLPPGFRPRGPGDWGPRGPPPPGMFRPRGPPLGGFGPRGPPMDWRGPLPGEFGPLGFRPRGPMDGPFRLHGDGPRGPPGPMGDFGPRGLDMHGPRPDMFPGPRPFGMRPPDNGQFAEDDFGIAGFNPGGPRMLAPLAKKKLKKSKKTKKTGSVADAKFATQKAKEPGKNKKDEKKDGQESEVDEDKLLATDDSSSSTSSDSESDDNEQQGKDAGNPRLPMQSPGGPPRPRFDQRPPHHQQRFHGRFEGPLPRHGQMEHRHRRPPPPLRQPLQQDGPPRMIQHNQHHPEHLPGQIQGQPQVIHLPPQGPDQPAVRMQLQPGQVLVRQIVPGLAQPVFRILQSGQLLQGQIPGQLPAQLQGQQIIQNLPAGHVFQQQPGGQPALVQLQQQQHNSARTGVSVSAAQMHLQSGINPDEARLPKQVAPNIVQLPNANNHVQHAQLPGQVRPSIVSSTAGAPLSTQPGQLRSAAPQGLQGNPGQPIFIPNSMGHPVQAGQNLNATLQASQQLILQQQQQLAAVQQQQLAFQQQHQQQIMQQQPQEMSQLQQQQQQQHRHDGRSQGRDHRRRRDDYSRGRRYNRTRSRSISRSRSRSWSGSDSQSRSRSSMSRSPSRSMSGSGSRSRSWSSGEDSRSPSPQRKKSGGRAAAERFDQNFRSNERYARQSSSSQHRQREFPPRQPPFPNKDEQRYEELERQRLRERERRDRERETGGTREQRPEKEYVPSKRRREEREPIEHREQANDSGRISESRQRRKFIEFQREDRKDSKSSRDHNVSKEQRTASSTDVGNRVLISSLPPSMSERKLKQLMQSVGEVENLKLSTTRHKALVAFTRSSTAVACRKKFHKYAIDDCKLLVEFA